MGQRKVQTSESIMVGGILALIGGYMDAYSYICRGGVFANAETGNIVLLALNLVSFQWLKAVRYMVPILAFGAGVTISEAVKWRRDALGGLHWRQITILIEMLILALVAFLPQSLNLAANSIISMTCGVQMSAFAKFHDIAMATTMCTGNLRSGTQCLHRFARTGDRAFLRQGLLYYGCIAAFIAGAMIGGVAAARFQEKSILAAAGGLLAVFLLMFARNRHE